MRRILIVITTGIAPTGGLTTVMMNYFRSMDRNGLKIDFASYNTGQETYELSKEMEANGSHYYCLGSRKNVPHYFMRLYKLCKGYDVIHVNGNSATTVIELLAAKWAGVKVRINHNHTSIPDHKKLSDMLHPLFNKLVTTRVACSELAGNWLYGKGNFLVLKNAINVEKYQFSPQIREKIRKEFGIEDGCTVIGHVGKIYKPKNHPYLIRIFAEYQKRNANSKLLLVGDGVMRPEVESLVDELGLRDSVIFAGLRTDVAEMLQAMDCFVFPSIWEGMPLSIIEALASGLTCVISDHISKEIMIGKHIHALQIESMPTVWADFIADYKAPTRAEVSIESVKAITSEGFNIREEAEKLRELYLN